MISSLVTCLAGGLNSGLQYLDRWRGGGVTARDRFLQSKLKLIKILCVHLTTPTSNVLSSPHDANFLLCDLVRGGASSFFRFSAGFLMVEKPEGANEEPKQVRQ